MSEDKSLNIIPQFDGQHYDHWSELMENFLRAKELWSMIVTGFQEPDETIILSDVQRDQLENARTEDHKVKYYLFQAIDRVVFEQILDRKTSKVVWNSLKSKYGGNEKIKKSLLNTLRREFEVLEMKNNETITEYFSRVSAVANQMRSNGEIMTDSKIIQKILRTLTEKFLYMVVSIEEAKDVDMMTLDELQSTLVVHEQKFKRIEKEDDQVLKASTEASSYFGGRGRGRGRNSNRGRGRGRGRQTFNKELVDCYNCHKFGHYAYECPDVINNKANYIEFGEEEELILMAHGECEENERKDAWFLDSGCSNHMCGDKKWFINLDENFQRTVKLGNDSKMVVAGKGNIRMKMNGLEQTVTEVYYVPELKNNLLSIGQLQEKDLTILIKGGECKLYHAHFGLILQTQMTTNRMFVLSASPITQMVAKSDSSTCFIVEDDNKMSLWHRRFCHLNNKGLRTMFYKKVVNGLPSLINTKKVCEHYLIGKQHREKMPKTGAWRAGKKLQLIHTDICGPISPKSCSGRRYILTFIDDYSRKTWIYFLSQKSEAFTRFKNFKQKVEKESGESVICLRTDNGGEFTSSEFNKYCDEHGIRRQVTTVYTPQQNGVAERRNRTIMNGVRSILSEKNVPKEFWPEAAQWYVYVMNRSLTKALMHITPEEVWTGIKPNVDYFRVFGSLAHVHIPDAKRVKLDDKSFKCVLFGVSTESKAYRLYDPIAKRIVISRDVVFEEDKAWNWNGESLIRKCGGTGNFETNQGCELEINESGRDAVQEEIIDTLSESQPEQVNERQSRIRRAPAWLQDYVSGDEIEDTSEEISDMIMFTIMDPVTFHEASKNKVWKIAMEQEMESIECNQTWKLVELPLGAKKIGVKWVYKTKLNEHGEIDKYKARLVAKGYAQEFGVDYNEVFAPVARWDAVRLVIALAAQKGWKIYQLDVKSAFLYGELSEDVYVAQPDGFIKKGEEHKVYKLQKALYGLKQAPRAWYSRIESYFVKEGFTRCVYEHTLFIKHGLAGKVLIVSLYVDDLLFTGNDSSMFDNFKMSMKNEFEMTDLGRMSFFLGVEVLQNDEGIFINQKKYAAEVLERFGLLESNPVKNPLVPGFKLTKDGDGILVNSTIFKQIVGCLRYLTVTRPDIMYVVGFISRFMEKPTQQHLLAAKRVLKYIRGTLDYGIFYQREMNVHKVDVKLLGYTDSDYAGDLEDRKSTSGYVYLLGEGAVAWSSKKQPIVTLSTTEAEYVAAGASACQGIWMKRLLETLNQPQPRSIMIFCDNSSTIKLAKNPVLHKRSKHIDVKFHFLRDLTQDGVIELVFCPSEDNIADIMTKALKLESFEKLQKKLGVMSLKM